MGVISAAVGLIATAFSGGKDNLVFYGFLLMIIGPTSCVANAEFLKLLMDIEQNTRRTAEALAKFGAQGGLQEPLQPDELGKAI
jgi:hypothetical protein